MANKKKYQSDILAALHETAAGFHEIGLIPTKKDEMRSDYSGVDLGKPVVGKHYKACRKGIKIVQKPCKATPTKKTRLK